jgi:hypothetical protein
MALGRSTLPEALIALKLADRHDHVHTGSETLHQA